MALELVATQPRKVVEAVVEGAECFSTLSTCSENFDHLRRSRERIEDFACLAFDGEGVHGLTDDAKHREEGGRRAQDDLLRKGVVEQERRVHE